MTEKQREKLEVCENNWVSCRSENNRQATSGGAEGSLTRKLVRLKWVGHAENIGGERLKKRADAIRVEGRKKEEEED